MSKGIPCPSCGGIESEVDKTIHGKGYTRRIFRCKACKKQYHTREQLLGTPPIDMETHIANRISSSVTAALMANLFPDRCVSIIGGERCSEKPNTETTG